MRWLTQLVAPHSRVMDALGREVIRRIAAACRAACPSITAVESHTARSTVEPLEGRVLFNTFHLYMSAPQKAVGGSPVEIGLWTTGEPVSGNIDVNWDDGGPDSSVTPSTSGIATASHTYTVTSEHFFNVTATATSVLSHNATTSFALQFPFGNYPASESGATVYLPNTSPQNSAASNGNALAVDPVTNDTYIAENYQPSGSAPLFGITRLTSDGSIDTTFGPLETGSTTVHTGTLVVSSFGGGTDVPYAAAVLETDTLHELAVAGSSSHGFAVAILNIATSGSVIATSDYTGSQTMPSGQANAVMFDSNNEIVAAGVHSGNFAAVKLFGSGSTAGELDSTFNSSGLATVTFPSSSTGSDAFAIFQNGSGSDLVLGGWAGFGSGCSASCDLAVAGINDLSGNLDTSGFGSSGTCMVNVGCAAQGSGFNGCKGSCSTGSNDSIYSLAWDDDISPGGDLIAVGGTNYSGSPQFAIWELSSAGLPDTGFGPSGVEVPNVNATAYGGTVDTIEDPPNATDGFIYAVGATAEGSPDIIVARINETTGALDAGGTSGDHGFGTSGYMTLDLGTNTTNSYVVGRGVAVLSDASVEVAGYTGTSGTGGKVAVARFLQYNQLDVSVPPPPAPPPAAASGVFSSGPMVGTPGDGPGGPTTAPDPLDLLATRRRAAGRGHPSSP